MSETLIDDRSGAGPDEGAEPTFDPPAPPSDPPSGDAPAPGGRVSRAIDRLFSMPVEGWITLLVVAACVAFIFVQLGPGNILANNTPAGGDMGGHVWGPAFLRDHLLTHGRLTGWTPDWYDGFPAYEFYMILPGLAIALLSYLIPYGIAFKLVVVSGVISLPVALWAFGRLSRLPFPTPALLAVGGTAYLFDRSFSIYGGNIASTLAGEFSFSIALSFAVLFLGVLSRGLETGKYRAWAAALLAATALCHIIPVFFAVAGAAILLALQLDWSRIRWFLWLALIPASFGLALVAGGLIAPSGDPHWPLYAAAAVYGTILVVLLAVVLLVVQHPWGHLKYLATVLPVGAMISAFWTGPFYLNSAYMTDMGWEKLTNYSDSLFARTQLASQLSDRPGIEYLLVLAAVGALMAFAYCRRGEIFWVVMAVLAGVAFLYVPQSRLWNARLLPFYYLAVYLVGAIAIAEVGRTVARLIASDVHRPPRVVLWITALGGLCVWLVVLGLPLRTLPFGTIDKDGVTYQWGPLKTKDSSFVTSWANWNFTGYEGKTYYPEYYAVVQQMAKIGKEQGCGRAMWEYSDSLNNYGTPMALMLLPYWTNGCIGSMEGLYFEASATTPYHFLNQSELSAAPFGCHAWPALRAGRAHPERLRPGHLPPADAGGPLLHGLHRHHPRLRPEQPRPDPVGHQRSVAHLPGGRLGRGGAAHQRAGRRQRGRQGGKDLVERHGQLVPRPDPVEGAVGRLGTGQLAAHRLGRGARQAAGGHDQGVEHRVRNRLHLLRRDQGRRAGRGEGLLLPQLAGLRGQRAVPREPEHDGGDPHQHAREAVLRVHHDRLRLVPVDPVRPGGPVRLVEGQAGRRRPGGAHVARRGRSHRRGAR